MLYSNAKSLRVCWSHRLSALTVGLLFAWVLFSQATRDIVANWFTTFDVPSNTCKVVLQRMPLCAPRPTSPKTDLHRAKIGPAITVEMHTMKHQYRVETSSGRLQLCTRNWFTFSDFSSDDWSAVFASVEDVADVDDRSLRLSENIAYCRNEPVPCVYHYDLPPDLRRDSITLERIDEFDAEKDILYDATMPTFSHWLTHALPCCSMAQADLFIVPLAVGNPDSTSRRHINRLLQLSPAFQKFPERHVFMLGTNSMESALGKARGIVSSWELYRDLRLGGTAAVTRPGSGYDTGAHFAMPYTPDHLLQQLSPHWLMHKDRPINVFFRGAADRSKARLALVDAFRDVEWASVEDGMCSQAPERRESPSFTQQGSSHFTEVFSSNGGSSYDEMSVWEYRQGVVNSKLCLITQGHTPTSRHLANAIASLCIPVFVTVWNHRPFDRILDYGRFSLTIPPSVWLKGDADSIRAWVQGWLDDKALMLSVRKELHKVRKYFVYGIKDMQRQCWQPSAMADLLECELRNALHEVRTDYDVFTQLGLVNQ